MKTPTVAVLGAGIMGSSLALMLARSGSHVTLFDQHAQPFRGASRWNEGKIHLGFLYNADGSMQSAQRMLPGGLSFKPLVEDLIGTSLDAVTTQRDDIYLCHRDSVVAPDAMSHYFERLAAILREAPDACRYLVDVSDCRIEKLSSAGLDSLSGSTEVVAGFRVPERSVETTWVADRFVAALRAEPRVEQALKTRVIGARPADRSDLDGGWLVDTAQGTRGPFDFVVNCLWEGRLAIDRSAGLAPAGDWTHRYRLSLFVHTRSVVDVPNVVIATGPFGDIKNYDGRNLYLSWYPAGLMCEGSEITPPAPRALDDAAREDVIRTIFDELGKILPGIAAIRREADKTILSGGWVFAVGRGSLADPGTTLHHRSDFGIRRLGSYISVDTGKYSTAPWLAREIAGRISAGA
jgi:glycine/D-amino acid oxidase-like deaminating enzyme